MRLDFILCKVEDDLELFRKEHTTSKYYRLQQLEK
jgi:hypothetical protein